MTARRLRDLRRLLESVAEPFGAAVVVEQTRGNHLRGTFTVGTHQAFIVTGLSPSDWRVNRNVESIARQKLRELTGGADLKVAVTREAGRSAP
jgi:hypothetical protein